MTFTIGFTTMTADLCHKGHVQFLRAAKLLCDYLIVGLTVDERCELRKRKPIMSFESRRVILEAIKYVDLVVEDRGQSKQIMCDDLNVNCIFVGEDYRESEEYTSLHKTHPAVRLYVIPRTTSTSTSELINSLESRVLSNIHIHARGVSFPILRIRNLDTTDTIIKYIPLGASEFMNRDGQDTYRVSNPLPRNWKGKPGQLYPMIAGINGWREVLIMESLKDVPFVPYVRYVLTEHSSLDSSSSASDSLIRLQQERRNPHSIIALHTIYAGDTLARHVANLPNDEFKIEKCDALFALIWHYIQVLRNRKIVHGDLHASNICVNQTGEIFFIDFGWAMSRSCAMTATESEYFESCLTHNFDWNHFVCSLDAFVEFNDISRPINSFGVAAN